MTSYPSWWGGQVRVVARADGRRGTLYRTGAGDDAWLIQLDASESYVAQPDPASWDPDVGAVLDPPQRDRIVHDAERALLRAFGCHYVPEYEALPESTRTRAAPHPRAVGRPELDGLQNVIRGAVAAALAPYTRG